MVRAGLGGVEWAGYAPSAELRGRLEDAAPVDQAPLRIVRLASDAGAADAKLAGPALWRRSEPGNSDELAEALAADIAAWTRHAPPPDLPLRGRRRSAPASTPATGETGLLLVTGGSQTRIGSHRMYERLAKALAEQRLSLPALRPARGRRQRGRGSGLSRQRPGSDAAAAPLRAECPALQRVIGFGLCDGATAIALFGDAGRARRADPGQSLAGRGRGRRARRPPRSAAIIGKRLLSLGRLEENPFRSSRLQEALARNSEDLRAPHRPRRWPRTSPQPCPPPPAHRADPRRPATPPRSRRSTSSSAGLSRGWPAIAQTDRNRLAHLRPPRRRGGAARGRGGGAGTRLARSGLLKRSSPAPLSKSASARNFSASSAAMQPVPAAVTAWR